MEKIAVSTKKDDANYEVIEKPVHRVEHLLSKNEYGENGFMKDVNSDMYRCIAYLYNNTSGMLDHELNAWNIIDKTGMIHDGVTLVKELAKLTDILKEAGISSLVDVTSEVSADDPEKVVLRFNFTSGSFILDTVLQNLT